MIYQTTKHQKNGGNPWEPQLAEVAVSGLFPVLRTIQAEKGHWKQWPFLFMCLAGEGDSDPRRGETVKKERRRRSFRPSS